jgi:hypothetical protein
MARCYLWLLLSIYTLTAGAVAADHLHSARAPGTASAATSSYSAPNGAATVAVAPLLAQAIAAMGGEDAIKNLQGIRSHA